MHISCHILSLYIFNEMNNSFMNGFPNWMINFLMNTFSDEIINSPFFYERNKIQKPRNRVSLESTIIS